jgi:hypothetical protein
MAVPTRKPQKPQPLTDPAEYQRFLDMAREVEADETSGAMDRAFEKVEQGAKSAKRKVLQHDAVRGQPDRED